MKKTLSLVALLLLLLSLFVTAQIYAHPQNEQNCNLSVCHNTGGVTVTANITGVVEAPPSSTFGIEVTANSEPTTNLTMIWPISTGFPVLDNNLFTFSPHSVQDGQSGDLLPEIYRMRCLFQVSVPSAAGYYTLQVFAAGGSKRGGSLILNLTVLVEGMPRIQTVNEGLRLTWSQSTDASFARYEIFQSTAHGTLGTSRATISDKTTTSYVASGLSSDTTYYFTLREWNTGGQYKDSVQVRVKTPAALIAETPFWQQSWFLVVIAAIVVGVAVVVILLLRRTGHITFFTPSLLQE